MSILQRAVFMAAKRAAADPRIQAKALEVARDEIAPRVRDAIERTRPVVIEAKQRASRAAQDLKDVAERHPPTDDPKAFVVAARERFKEKN